MAWLRFRKRSLVPARAIDIEIKNLDIEKKKLADTVKFEQPLPYQSQSTKQYVMTISCIYLFY